MKVIIDMVISPNGYIARLDGSEDWLPQEGWDEFVLMAKTLNNIVMGRETYEQVKARYKDENFDSVDCENKIIITRKQEFAVPEGYIVLHSPEEAIDYIEDKGLDKLFVIGGGKLISEFIQRGLVNEVQLTITPYIIGQGRPVIYPAEFDLPLKLIDHKELSGGRIRLKYEVVPNN